MEKLKVHFKTTDGNIETVECPEFNTVMEASRYYSKASYIESIDAECGGACACATCHVIVDEKWIDKVGKPNPTSAEQELLDYDPKAHKNSRLSCQITLDKSLDGLIVHIPK
jgi:2Fe-2S ferredoxin|tara:strand:+ start:167 stop:502 length:336 start_codon:yes stop_codon:yes gene_type:complete